MSFNVSYYNAPVGAVAMYGVNLQICYSRWGQTTAQKVAAQISTLDQMKGTGLRALVELIVPPYNEEQVRGLILGLRDRPEIWGWYLADEPDLPAQNGLPQVAPTEAIAAYDLVKALDPLSRPVATAFTPTLNIGQYAGAMDIYMVDYYPIRGGDLEFQSPDFRNYYSAVWKFNQYARTNIHKPFWPILQASRLSRPICPSSDPNYPLCGFPTVAEERYMIYSAILAGAQGLSFFDTNNEESESVLEARFASEWLAPILHEFSKFSNSFVGAPVGSVVTDSNIDTSVMAKLYKDLDAGGDNYVLLVVQLGPQEHLPTSVIFKDPAIDGSNDVINSQDFPLPTFSGGRMSIELGPYEVRIYKFGLSK
jgi:hypothetical protein